MKDKEVEDNEDGGHGRTVFFHHFSLPHRRWHCPDTSEGVSLRAESARLRWETGAEIYGMRLDETAQSIDRKACSACRTPKHCENVKSESFLCLVQAHCLYVSPFVSQSVSQSVCQPVSLSVCRSVRLSVGQSVSQSVSLSACQSVGLSVCRSVGLSVCRSVCLSVCLFLWGQLNPKLPHIHPHLMTKSGSQTSNMASRQAFYLTCSRLQIGSANSRGARPLRAWGPGFGALQTAHHGAGGELARPRSS